MQRLLLIKNIFDGDSPIEDGYENQKDINQVFKQVLKVDIRKRF